MIRFSTMITILSFRFNFEFSSEVQYYYFHNTQVENVVTAFLYNKAILLETSVNSFRLVLELLSIETYLYYWKPL